MLRSLVDSGKTLRSAAAQVTIEIGQNPHTVRVAFQNHAKQTDKKHGPQLLADKQSTTLLNICLVMYLLHYWPRTYDVHFIYQEM